MSLHSERILLIEDDEIQRVLARKILEGAGYQVDESNTIEEGLNKAKKTHPHLIILDLVLPKSSGFEFLEQRRIIPDLAKIPVLVLSGLTDKESIYQATALGANEYSVKPLNASLLIQKVKKTLKDRSFESIKLPESPRVKVKTQVQGTITLANEVGFLIQVPFKVAPSTQLNLQSTLLTDLSCKDCIFQKTKKPAKMDAAGQYLNEVSVVGLNKQSIERIRSIMRSWK